MNRTQNVFRDGAFLATGAALGWLSYAAPQSMPQELRAEAGSSTRPATGNDRGDSAKTRNHASEPAESESAAAASETNLPDMQKWFHVPPALIDPRANHSGPGVRINASILAVGGPEWFSRRLTPGEIDAVKKLLLKTRGQIAPLAPHPQLLRSDAQSSTYTIGSFESGDLERQFLWEMQCLLGEETAAILLASSRHTLDPWLFSFGRAPSEFTIHRGVDGMPYLNFRFGARVDGEGLDFWAASYAPLGALIAERQAAWMAEDAAKVPAP